MIKLIKFIIFYSIELIYYLDQFSKYTYRLIFNALFLQLKVLPVQEIFNFFYILIFNKLTDNSILGKIAIPLGVNWKILCDTKLKKLFLLIITTSLLFYRWFIILKKVFLWPFKLGLFSLFYSILGFDVTWFLNLFNIFTVNIPQWVYFQYLLLYTNWMNWWYNFVNIKSLNTSSLPSSQSK